MPRAPASSAKQIFPIGLVRGDAHQRRRLLAAHRLDRRLQLLDLPGGVLGIEQQEVVRGAWARIDTSTFGVTVVPTTVLPDLIESLMAFIWPRYLPK